MHCCAQRVRWAARCWRAAGRATRSATGRRTRISCRRRASSSWSSSGCTTRSRSISHANALSSSAGASSSVRSYPNVNFNLTTLRLTITAGLFCSTPLVGCRPPVRRRGRPHRPRDAHDALLLVRHPAHLWPRAGRLLSVRLRAPTGRPLLVSLGKARAGDRRRQHC